MSCSIIVFTFRLYANFKALFLFRHAPRHGLQPNLSVLLRFTVSQQKVDIELFWKNMNSWCSSCETNSSRNLTSTIIQPAFSKRFLIVNAVAASRMAPTTAKSLWVCHCRTILQNLCAALNNGVVDSRKRLTVKGSFPWAATFMMESMSTAFNLRVAF